ncbi:hypothetical protein ACIO3N_11255, partial [Kitasatospora aureofaciens]
MHSATKTALRALAHLQRRGSARSTARGRVAAAAGVAAALLAVLPGATASAASHALPKAQSTGRVAVPAQDGAAHHLYNLNSGLCLNVSGYSQSPSSSTQIYNCLSQSAEQW